MRFAFFALSTVPDTGTAQALHVLPDLDSRHIAKVLSHRCRRLQAVDAAWRRA